MVDFFWSRHWYGAALWGQSLTVVRSNRALTGRINTTTLARSPASAGRREEMTGLNQPVVGCIGIQESLTLWLDTPFRSINKTLKVLPSMLDLQLPFPLEDCCYCFVQFRRKTAGSVSTLAVAVRRTVIQQRLAQYRAVGIDPIIIDHEGLALWQQSLREKPSLAGKMRVVLSLEADHIAVVIGLDGLYLNAHSLQISAGAEAEMTSEATLNRLRRIFCAELQIQKPVEWIFCGPLARQTRIVNSLHGLLNRDWPGAMIVQKSPETFLARALASRAFAGGWHRCDLRLHDLTHPDVQARRKKHVARAFFLLLLTGILLCLFNMAWQVIGSLQFNNARQAVSRLARELAPDSVIVYGREVNDVQKVMQKRVNEVAPLLNMFARPLSIRLAEIINAGKEANLNYTRIELNREKVMINGTAEDWNYCDRLVKYLGQIGYRVEIERREPDEDNLIRFTVRGIVQP